MLVNEKRIAQECHNEWKKQIKEDNSVWDKHHSKNKFPLREIQVDKWVGYTKLLGKQKKFTYYVITKNVRNHLEWLCVFAHCTKTSGGGVDGVGNSNWCMLANIVFREKLNQLEGRWGAFSSQKCPFTPEPLEGWCGGHFSNLSPKAGISFQFVERPT